MKNIRSILIFMAIIDVFAIIFLLLGDFISFHSELISLLLTFLGLIGIVWYVEETHRQSEASWKPYLRLQWYNPIPKEKDDNNGIIQLVNIGKGPATNIEFNELTFSNEPNNPIINLQISNIPAMSAVSGGGATIGKRQMDITSSSKETTNEPEINDKSPRDKIRKFLEDKERGEYKITVTYKDLEGKKHTVKFAKDDKYNDGFRIISQS